MFDPYPWQENRWQLLIETVRENRLGHALLFHGEQGLGKRDFAKAFSAYVLCDFKQKNRACGDCQSCQWFRAGSHPDYFPVSLEENSKSIKIDQLRELKNQLEKTSQRGSYQVAVIESSDTMNRSAANALLKTLEEPAGPVVIILVANRVSTLPATIMSRCQLFKFCAVQNDASIQWLRDRIDRDIDAEMLLKIAEYAPLRALAFSELNYFEWRDQLLRHLLRIVRREIQPISSLDHFLKQQISFIFNIFMSLLADVLRLQHGISSQTLLHSDRFSQLQCLAQSHDKIQLHRCFQTCQSALASLQSGIHVNPQLLLENILIEYSGCSNVH